MEIKNSPSICSRLLTIIFILFAGFINMVIAFPFNNADIPDDVEISILQISMNETSDPLLIMDEGQNESLIIKFSASEDLESGSTIVFQWEMDGETGTSEWIGNADANVAVNHSILDFPAGDLDVGVTYELVVEVVSVNDLLLNEVGLITSVVLQPSEDHFAIDFTTTSDHIRFY